jgi:hypothetical protein
MEKLLFQCLRLERKYELCVRIETARSLIIKQSEGYVRVPR